MSKLPVVKGENELLDYVREIEKVSLLTPKEEFELAKKYYDDGDQEAAKQLVLANLKFVIKIAMEYRHYGFRLMDLIQEGNVGLMTAVKKYDPYKGYKFITYAVWWIRAYIQRYIIKNWSLVTMGTTEAERKLFYKLGAVKNALMLKSPESATSENIAKELGVTVKDVEDMDVRLNRGNLSIDAEINDEGQTTFSEILPSKEDNQEDLVLENERQLILKEKISEAMKNLNEREAFIVKERLMAEKSLTLQAIADKYGISRERVRQIENNTIKKLRNLIGEELI